MEPHETSGRAERRLASAIRDACLREIERAREDAAIQGLCNEGALEYALDRLRHLEPGALLARTDMPHDPTSHDREDP